jgi:hypothetical protein
MLMLSFLLASIGMPAHAAELEVVVRDAATGADLVVQQFDDPTAGTWPQTFTFGVSGSATVRAEQAGVGQTRFCVEFRAESTDPLDHQCVTVSTTDPAEHAVLQNEALVVGILLDLDTAFSSVLALDPIVCGSAIQATCSVTCDNGSSCNINCPNGCSANCNSWGGANCYCR